MGYKSLAQIPARRNRPVSYTLSLRATSQAREEILWVVAVESTVIPEELSAPLAFPWDLRRNQVFK